MTVDYKTLALSSGLLTADLSAYERELMETKLRIFKDAILLEVLQTSLKHADELFERGAKDEGCGILTNNGVLVKHFGI